MVRTMENATSYVTNGPSPMGTENGDVYHDDLTSDFSIISHPSVDVIDTPQGANFDFLNNVQLPLINQQMGMASLTTSTDEIQQQLRDIVKENVELKEALQQNNVTLRHHFGTIVKWQEQYNKARIRQKEIVENMRQLTDTLQEDKKKLLEQLEVTNEQIEKLIQDKEKVCLDFEEKDKKLKETELQLAQLKPELESQQVQCLHLEGIVKELQVDINTLRKDKTTLQTELHEMRKKKDQPSFVPIKQITPFVVTEEDMDYAVVHSGPSSHSSDELALMKLTIQAMTEEKSLFANLLKEEQQQTKKLKSELEMKNSEITKMKEKEKEIGASWVRSLTAVAAPPDETISMMEEEIVNKSIMSVNGAHSELEKCHVRFENINQQLGQCQERILASMQGSATAAPDVQKLWDELNILRTVVKDEQDAKESYRNQLEEAQATFRREYQSLVNQWESYKSDIKTQGKQLEALSEIEKRQSQERLDELTATVIHLEESLQEKDRDMERTKNRIKMLERELEQVPILRSRNELFQIELQKAEEAKKQKDEHMETQKKDILTLQAQIIQLTDELSQQSAQQLEIYRRPHKHPQERGTFRSHHSKVEQGIDAISSSKSKKCPVHKGSLSSSSNNPSLELVGACGGNSGNDSMPKSNPRSYEDPEKMRTCPRCFATFHGMQALNNHVQRCCFDDDPFR